MCVTLFSWLWFTSISTATCWIVSSIDEGSILHHKKLKACNLCLGDPHVKSHTIDKMLMKNCEHQTMVEW
jgi:hypothetical protein